VITELLPSPFFFFSPPLVAREKSQSDLISFSVYRQSERVVTGLFSFPLPFFFFFSPPSSEIRGGLEDPAHERDQVRLFPPFFSRQGRDRFYNTGGGGGFFSSLFVFFFFLFLFDFLGGGFLRGGGGGEGFFLLFFFFWGGGGVLFFGWCVGGGGEGGGWPIPLPFFLLFPLPVFLQNGCPPPSRAHSTDEEEHECGVPSPFSFSSPLLSFSPLLDLRKR